MKTALITGITGQDGSYLAELLLSKGYEVHGLMRRASTNNLQRIEHIREELHLHHGDLNDAASVIGLIATFHFDEIYNLAAQSHVQVSFENPSYTASTDFVGHINLLDAVKEFSKGSRYYQASSSEMFGLVQEIPQRETTPFYPRSPYGCAKVGAHWATINYREAHNLHASNGILFNHESPRRGEQFVTRKIAKAVAEIALGQRKRFSLGNIEAKRDWGYAKDFVKAMWMMLQQPAPGDYVIATGETHTVREFLEEAFSVAREDYHKLGEWQAYVDIDGRLFRPSEVDLLLGDASKAREKLGWFTDTSFKQLVRIMVTEELGRLQL